MILDHVEHGLLRDDEYGLRLALAKAHVHPRAARPGVEAHGERRRRLSDQAQELAQGETAAAHVDLADAQQLRARRHALSGGRPG